MRLQPGLSLHRAGACADSTMRPQFRAKQTPPRSKSPVIIILLQGALGRLLHSKQVAWCVGLRRTRPVAGPYNWLSQPLSGTCGSGQHVKPRYVVPPVSRLQCLPLARAMARRCSCAGEQVQCTTVAPSRPLACEVARQTRACRVVWPGAHAPRPTPYSPPSAPTTKEGSRSWPEWTQQQEQPSCKAHAKGCTQSSSCTPHEALLLGIVHGPSSNGMHRVPCGKDRTLPACDRQRCMLVEPNSILPVFLAGVRCDTAASEEHFAAYQHP